MTNFRISLELPACTVVKIEKTQDDLTEKGATWTEISPPCECAQAISQRLLDGIAGKHKIEPTTWAEGLKNSTGVIGIICERSDCEDCPWQL